LGTAWTAEEHGAGAAGGVGNGGVDDLDELRVADGKHVARITDGEMDEVFVIRQSYAPYESQKHPAGRIITRVCECMRTPTAVF
jgi:hypothetical protein